MKGVHHGDGGYGGGVVVERRHHRRKEVGSRRRSLYPLLSLVAENLRKMKGRCHGEKSLLLLRLLGQIG